MAGRRDPPSKKEEDNGSRVLKVLEALKRASQVLQTHPFPDSNDLSSAAIKVLLQLETESETILSKDRTLSALFKHLAKLKKMAETFQKTPSHFLTSFLTRRVMTISVSRVASSIEEEIEAWIDRRNLEKMTGMLREQVYNEEELIELLIQLENRLSKGFNHQVQAIVLKSKVFPLLNSVLCNPNSPNRIREHCATAIGALIKFNKNVFVGQVQMGPTARALITMATSHSIGVLGTLIRLIKSPLVDEIESMGEIPSIIHFLSSQDLEMQIVAFNCILEIGYFGRKEAVDAMFGEGLIEKLVELERSELGDGNEEEEEEEEEKSARERSERKRQPPFAGCVAAMAVQLEVGEGLRERERREMKKEILKRVGEASACDGQTATIVAEVLWGSTP